MTRIIYTGPRAPRSAIGDYEWGASGAGTGTHPSGTIRIPKPRNKHDYISRLIALHEMGHAFADNVLGVTWNVFVTDRVRYEAQASAYALAWIKPGYYDDAYRHCRRWLKSYIIAWRDDDSDAGEILDNAISEMREYLGC